MNLDRSRARAKIVEEAVRERAMLPINFDINGWEVKQFTLRHFRILLQVRSPFLFGRMPRIEDVGVFLWVVSPEYDHASFVTPWTLMQKVRRWLANRRRKAFMERLVKHPRWSLFEPRIQKYLKRAFMDRPPTGPGGKAIAASYDASMIFRIASVTHWSEVEIVKMPMARLFQYLNWIAAPTQAPQFFPLQSAVIDRWYKKQPAKEATDVG